MSEFETIKARGQTIHLGNETWENKLIDVRTGRGITIMVNGNATIRNVGVKGLYRGGSFIFSITTSSGPVKFENVYIGDGATKEGESFVHGPGAIFRHRNATCDVTFERCNVQGYPNNAFYMSNTAHGGSVTFENCYGKNNGVTTFRTGSSRDKMVNCVAYNDGTDYGPGFGGYTEDKGRPLWHWGSGTIRPKNCHFAAGSYPAAIITHESGRVVMDGGAVTGGTQGRVDTSSAGRTPTLKVPEGCPRVAEEAAAGATGGDSGGSGYGDGGYGLGNYANGEPWKSDPNYIHNPGANQFNNRLTINALDGTAHYALAADEVVKQGYWYISENTTPHNLYNGEITFDEVDGLHTAEGHVEDNIDAFVTDGAIEALTVDGDVEVWLNGEEIDPDDYAEFDDVFTSPDDPDKDEMIDRLREEKQQLEEQLQEYDERINKVDELLGDAEENLSAFGSIFKAIREALK